MSSNDPWTTSGPGSPPPPGGGPGGPAPDRPVSGPVVSGSWQTWSAKPVTGEQGPEWTAWHWAASGDGRRGISWLGVLLVLLGVALFIQQVNPAISFTSLFLLAF